MVVPCYRCWNGMLVPCWVCGCCMCCLLLPGGCFDVVFYDDVSSSFFFSILIFLCLLIRVFRCWHWEYWLKMLELYLRRVDVVVIPLVQLLVRFVLLEAILFVTFIRCTVGISVVVGMLLMMFLFFLLFENLSVVWSESIDVDM